MKLVFIHGWGLDATLWDGVCALLPEFEQERIDLGFFGSQEQDSPPPLAVGIRGGLAKQETPSPAKTKDLAKAKSKFLLPLPPGERNNILIGHSLGFVHGLNKHQDWRGWIAINSFPRFVESKAGKGCVSAPVLRDMRMRLIANTNLTLFGFYQLLGLPTPKGTPNSDRLRDGLDALRDLDISEAAAKLAPGVVIASKNDPLVPVATSVALAEGENILWHEDGGHVLPLTDPAFCAGAIRTFMEQHGFDRA
jgi:pimeloyl-[acyl-carrier protein] methyl ester esterase